MLVRGVRPIGAVFTQIALTLVGILGISLPLAMAIILLCGD